LIYINIKETKRDIENFPSRLLMTCHANSFNTMFIQGIEMLEDYPAKNTGLNNQQVLERLRTEGFNELPVANKRGFFSILGDVLREPMFSLLLVAGLIYLVLGDTTEAILLLMFAGFSVSITLIQETRSERVLESLRDLASPRALVLRNGERVHIAGREVVRDDIVFVSEGDRVAADARLLSAHDLQVDESLLTGESVPVNKIVLSDTTSEGKLLAGTLVVRGTGQALVYATGLRTEMGSIGRALNTIETEQPHLQKQMRGIVRSFAIIGLIAATIAVLLFGIFRGSWLEALLSGIALSMSLLPEEFPLVLTVFMAMGAWRISQAQVLTRRAVAIETLGATTVLCTDKTGTLTENRMTLSAMSNEKFSWFHNKNNVLDESLKNVLNAALLASAFEPTDPMEKAIRHLAETQIPQSVEKISQYTMLHTFGLRPDLLAVTNVLRDIDCPPDSGELFVYSKGALEAITQLCQLPPETILEINAQANELARLGFRVLGVATSMIPSAEKIPKSPRDIKFEYVGLIGFVDPLRATVPGAITECRNAGIRVVMITGDYPITALTIGKQAGIEADDAITGDEIEVMSEAQLALCVKTHSIFARIRPNQKLRIVQSLKAQGEIVAMTGDGVNDAPALKAAHIGVAMGRRGTDVAREASAIVLLNDDFQSIVKTIRLGRRIYDNLRKAIEYIIAVHIPIAGLAILPLLMGMPLMLSPIHIAFLEMVIDPACSVVFEAEAEEEDVMTRPPRDPKSNLLLPRRVLWGAAQGTVALVLLAGVLIAGFHLQLPESDLRGLVFSSLVFVNIGLILVNRSYSASLLEAFLRRNLSLGILLSLVIALLSLAIFWPPAQKLFHFGKMHGSYIVICFALSVISVVILETIKKMFNKVLL
jgi:P-type Ca2+ transporter type 2C